MSNDMCEELIVEIFSRLPSKSLLRFRSLSKSLHARIASRSFIRSHEKAIIIHKLHHKNVYTLHSGGQFTNNPYAGITPVVFPFTRFTIFGSCNGIICVYEHGKNINLWNPSIRRNVTIPLHDGRCLGQWEECGFGFDTTIDDYKILRITQKGSFVYTVKTRTWRKIASPTGHYCCVANRPCLLNGVLHWGVTCYSVDALHDYVLTFDLSSEVFSAIEVPKPSWETNVTIIKGCLALISSEYDACWIWLRREHNNAAASWYVAFKLNTNPLQGTTQSSQVFPNDELLCSITLKGIAVDIVAYNPKTDVLTQLVNLSDSSSIVGMDTCVESLELLDTGIQLIMGSKYTR
ncbi:hypothetical protein QVD17_05877 [Tagetes erecta]|uniref:F-box domain-containing protein n=1 Tax=Tagetes erecta TaxID=13708 RepID=A0AAD8LKL9_TARER|nr:hypothetical protein QVD17_05877 [Tagetes erecta]